MEKDFLNKNSFYCKDIKGVLEYYKEAQRIIRNFAIDNPSKEIKMLGLISEFLLRAECRELLKNVDVEVSPRPTPSQGQTIY